MLSDITRVYEEMAREIGKREDLLIVSAPGSTVFPPVPHSIATIPTNDTWARDHGFITVVEEERNGNERRGERREERGERGEKREKENIILLDFKFNGWGEKFPAQLDNAINRQLWDKGLVRGTYEPHLDFVLEGGSIESDGQGTIFTTECCLMAAHRNQPLAKQQIEERLKCWLGAKRVVWLQHGALIGDDTDGHIDTLVRICPDNTLLYTGGDEAHPDLELLERELQELRTLEGLPYRLLRLPLPRPINDEGQRLPATYANYLVINGAVLVPTYGQEDLDQEALNTISQAYPEREMVAIDCRPVIRQHGSLHCCTMQLYG